MRGFYAYLKLFTWAKPQWYSQSIFEKFQNSMKGIYHNNFKKISKGKLKEKYDLSETPLDYRNRNKAISSQTNFVETLFKLSLLGSLKG